MKLTRFAAIAFLTFTLLAGWAIKLNISSQVIPGLKEIAHLSIIQVPANMDQAQAWKTLDTEIRTANARGYKIINGPQGRSVLPVGNDAHRITPSDLKSFDPQNKLILLNPSDKQGIDVQGSYLLTGNIEQVADHLTKKSFKVEAERPAVWLYTADLLAAPAYFGSALILFLFLILAIGYETTNRHRTHIILISQGWGRRHIAALEIRTLLKTVSPYLLGLFGLASTSLFAWNRWVDSHDLLLAWFFSTLTVLLLITLTTLSWLLSIPRSQFPALLSRQKPVQTQGIFSQFAAGTSLLTIITLGAVTLTNTTSLQKQNKDLEIWSGIQGYVALNYEGDEVESLDSKVDAEMTKFMASKDRRGEALLFYSFSEDQIIFVNQNFLRIQKIKAPEINSPYLYLPSSTSKDQQKQELKKANESLRWWSKRVKPLTNIKTYEPPLQIFRYSNRDDEKKTSTNPTMIVAGPGLSGFPPSLTSAAGTQGDSGSLLVKDAVSTAKELSQPGVFSGRVTRYVDTPLQAHLKYEETQRKLWIALSSLVISLLVLLFLMIMIARVQADRKKAELLAFALHGQSSWKAHRGFLLSTMALTVTSSVLGCVVATTAAGTPPSLVLSISAGLSIVYILGTTLALAHSSHRAVSSTLIDRKV